MKNVVDFGAFVDLGVGTDGLLHISELRKGRADRRPAADAMLASGLLVGAQLRVRVKAVEIQDHKSKRARIGLQLCDPEVEQGQGRKGRGVSA